jgi:FMN phosphatase YigB (HAD superfamily)
MTSDPLETPASAPAPPTEWEQGEPETEAIAFEREPIGGDTSRADAVAVPALGHATLAAVRDLVESDAVDVVSTDVFDTLVWRRTLNPADVFVELGSRLAADGMLAPSLDPGSFGRLRRLAEERVRADRRKSEGDTEVRLTEIYEALPAWVFDDRSSEEALQAELGLEQEIIVPDLDVVDLLERAVERGKTIVAISDIYFSADQLRYLLSQPQLGALPFRHVFTSSDHRDGKAGKLFDIALAALDCQPVRMVHIGDNPKADIEPADERGIRAVYLEKRSESFEAILDREAMFGRAPISTGGKGPRKSESKAVVDFGLTALRAKTEHRTEARSIPTGLRAHWRFGATVLGPVLAGFAEWVHREARALGADRVHCLMREGEFLSEFIDGAAPAADWPVAAGKLWLSRFVATRAAIGAGTEEELERLMFGPAPPTVGEFCRRLDLGVHEIPTLAGYADTVLYDPIIRRLVLDSILDNDELRGRIVADSRRLRERVVSSLLRAAPDDGPIVLVDIGWGATIQQRLVEALGHAGVDRPVAGLYLMTNDVAGLAVTRGHRIAGFLMNCGSPDHLAQTVMRAPEILEQSLMPDFGTQIGLGDDLAPIVAQSAIPQQQIAEAAAVRRGAFAFQRDYVRYRTVLPAKLVSLAQAQDALAAVLTRSVVAPTAEEVTAFGGWIHDENYGSGNNAPLIDEGWSEKVRHLTPKQLADQPMAQMYWPFGVAHRVDESIGDLAAAASAGAISWDATATPLETGRFIVRATEGIGESKPVELEPYRNRSGLSFVSGALTLHQIQRLEIVLAERACVMRIDWLEFRLFAQGEPEPIVVRIEGSDALRSLAPANCLVLPASLIVCTGSPAMMVFDVRSATSRIVSRVEFEAGFAALPGGPVLPGTTQLEDMVRTRTQFERLQGTRLWRLTRPLRSVALRLRSRRRS